MPRLQLILEDEPREPALDTAIGRALLTRVAAGELPETLRLARPAPIVAFGKQDAIAPGYATAVGLARARSFEAVLRLAGGRAAVFHEGTVALGHAAPHPAPREGIHERFRLTGVLIASALRSLGVDARVGEVPGEYCAGAYSVNARGERKLAGIGQRLIARASYMGGVIVVTDAARVRDVLVPVYEALALEWRPETTGAVADETPSASWTAVRDALVAAYGERYELEPARLDDATLALARELTPEHLPARAAA